MKIDNSKEQYRINERIRVREVRLIDGEGEKSEVKIWECRNCGHIVVGTKAPEVCPTCNHPQSYFEVHAENY